MKYSIKIFYSEEDEGYIALSEELDNISSFGATEEEALKEIKNAISLYFEEKNIQLKRS
ncbi:type II toxin-antitoxin system HicB family antitoxin [Brachyspira pulli]|uniref:type II toxin-antitoxin system HicB family antitoxin n=1 Tax=Brachyspira pulli TaxID=310721 RepID=UPI003003D291